MIDVGIIRERILAYQRMTYLNIGKSALSLIPAFEFVNKSPNLMVQEIK